MNMREKIARALCPTMLDDGYYDEVPVDEVFSRPRYQHLAERAYRAVDAVLEAMREPDSRMRAAADDAQHEDDCTDTTMLWQSMIDAARQ